VAIALFMFVYRVSITGDTGMIWVVSDWANLYLISPGMVYVWASVAPRAEPLGWHDARGGLCKAALAKSRVLMRLGLQNWAAETAHDTQ
jgi:hypothetical protein